MFHITCPDWRYVFLYLFLFLSFFMSFFISFFLSFYISFFLSFFLFFFLSFFLSRSLFLSLSLSLSFSFSCSLSFQDPLLKPRDPPDLAGGNSDSTGQQWTDSGLTSQDVARKHRFGAGHGHSMQGHPSKKYCPKLFIYKFTCHIMSHHFHHVDKTYPFPLAF